MAVMLKEEMYKNYGVVGDAWLFYLSTEYSQKMKDSKTEFEEYCNALRINQYQGHIQRVARIFAVIATAGEMASKAGITGWSKHTAFKAVQNVFMNWLKTFSKAQNEPVNEVIGRLQHMIWNEQSRFEYVDSAKKKYERVKNRLGFIKEYDGEMVYMILPKQFHNELCQGLDPTKVSEILLTNGLLITDNCKNSKTKTVKIPNICQKTIRVYAIRSSILSFDIDCKGN